MKQRLCSSAHAAHPTTSNGALQFGSNVSRLKSRFLQHTSDVAEPIQPSCRQRPRTQRQSSLPPTATAPVTAGDFLQDMADHVEKFRHTRALFAQLAEQDSAGRPSPLPRSIPRSFRSTSSASPPPTRASHVLPERRSVSPSNDLHNTRSLGQTVIASQHQIQGQTRSCNGAVAGVTTWSQLGSRSQEESSRSVTISSRSYLGSRSSVETSRSLTESSRSTSSWRGDAAVDPNDIAGVILRRNNRPNLDLSVGAGRADLLPKRRSREEKTLTVSKDCLEASLCQADEYWRRQQMDDFSIGDGDQLMSESTFSSGSGEEMARSESGHDLATVLKDTTVSPTADSAEMWSRRLSAAMEAKSSETDSCRSSAADDCNGVDHVMSRTAENCVAVTLSRSLLARCDLDSTESDCKILTCSATDYSQHITAQNHNNRTDIDLSRSFEPSRSSVHCDGGSSPVSESVKSNATDYSQHVTLRTDNGSNTPTAVNLSRSFPVQGDLENAVKGNTTYFSSEHVTVEINNTRTLPTANNFSRSLPVSYDLEGGSSTDCEVLEGSVADCECKDVDTEKSSVEQESTNCCDTVALSTSLITSSQTDDDDNDDDGASLQQNQRTEQSESEMKSSCNGLDLSSQLQENADVDDACVDQQRGDGSCGLDDDGQLQETLSAAESDRVLLHEEQKGVDHGSQLHHVEVYDLSTNKTGIYLQKTDDSDTVFVQRQNSASASGAAWCPQQTRGSGYVFGTSEGSGYALDTSSRADDVQAMSVSEDDESSGDTDYVVLGEPVSRQTIRSTMEAVQQSHRTNVT